MADNQAVDPDVMLERISRGGLIGSLIKSVVIHLVVVALTSFGLYKAWAKWGLTSEKGFNTPAVIKSLEKEAQKAEARKAKEAAEAAARDAKLQENAKQMSAEDASASKNVGAPKPATPASPAGSDAPAKALPLEKEVSAPPKNFDLDSIEL